MDDWLAGWKGGIVPLRNREGFVILGAWVDRAHDRFVWLLGYDGADGFDAAEDRYHSSDARSAMSPEPSDFIDEATLDMVESTL
jgi:hypothetical protein